MYKCPAYNVKKFSYIILRASHYLEGQVIILFGDIQFSPKVDIKMGRFFTDDVQKHFKGMGRSGIHPFISYLR